MYALIHTIGFDNTRWMSTMAHDVIFKSMFYYDFYLSTNFSYVVDKLAFGPHK